MKHLWAFGTSPWSSRYSPIYLCFLLRLLEILKSDREVLLGSFSHILLSTIGNLLSLSKTNFSNLFHFLPLGTFTSSLPSHPFLLRIINCLIPVKNKYISATLLPSLPPCQINLFHNFSRQFFTFSFLSYIYTFLHFPEGKFRMDFSIAPTVDLW